MRRNEWWVPGKIVEAREQLQHFWRVCLSLQDCSHIFTAGCNILQHQAELLPGTHLR